MKVPETDMEPEKPGMLVSHLHSPHAAGCSLQHVSWAWQIGLQSSQAVE